MANDAKVLDAFTLAQKLAKGVPMTGIDLTICNLVNAVIWKAFPWRDSLSVFTPVALVDSVQDIATGLTDIMSITQFWITRTDVTPKITTNINVSKNITIDLTPVSPYSIRAASYQAGANKFRLERAVRIPTGSTFTLGGEYQPHPSPILDLNNNFWFADENLEVFAHGLVYWAYRLADDKRAGDAVKIGDGRVQYSGQLAQFRAAIEEMAANEDFGNLDGYYPGDSLGSVDGRRWYGNDLFPYLL